MTTVVCPFNIPSMLRDKRAFPVRFSELWLSVEVFMKQVTGYRSCASNCLNRGSHPLLTQFMYRPGKRVVFSDCIQDTFWVEIKLSIVRLSQ